MMDTVKLGDIGVFVSGGTPSRKHPEYFEGTIPWVSTPALNGGLLDESDAVQLITEDAISNSATKLLPSRSLLIGIRVGVGKTAVNSVPMCTNQDIVAITGVDEARWDIRYVSYAVQAKSAYLVSQKQGATITGITSKLLKSLEIKQLDIGAQHSRVSNLDYVKKWISDCKSQREKLDELVKSRFVEMFGDPIENPMRWDLKAIGEVYEVGSAKRVYARDQVSEGVPFLRLGDLTNRIQLGVESCDLFISEELYSEHKERGLVPDAGDILVTARGTMGLCYVIKEDDKFYFQDGMITWLHAKPESPLPVFLTNLFGNAHFDEDLHSRTSGTTVKYLSIKTLSRLTMIVPPLALQQEFAAFVQQIDKLEFETQQAIDKLQMLYDSLAQEYFGNE